MNVDFVCIFFLQAIIKLKKKINRLQDINLKKVNPRECWVFQGYKLRKDFLSIVLKWNTFCIQSKISSLLFSIYLYLDLEK